MTSIHFRRIGRYLAVLLCGLSGGVPASQAQTLNEEAKLAKADVPAATHMGTAAAISGDTAVLGAPDENGGIGAAYVFTRSAGNWTFAQRLTASDGVVGDRFGYAVSIAGDNLAVGAPGRQASRGAVYTFLRSAGTFAQDAPLVASDGLAGDQFGFSLSIQGLDLAVGAPFDTLTSKTGQGSGYVFHKSGPTGVWSQQFHMVESGGAVRAGDHIGWATSLSGNTVAFGAPDDDFGNRPDQGSVYVYIRNNTVWTKQVRLNPGGAGADRSGSAVALFANTLLVGADGQDPGTLANSGAAYVFTRDPVTNTWNATPTSKLTASDAAAHDHFGASVALAGSFAIIGAPGDDPAPGAARGKAYLYALTGAVLTQQAKLVALDNAVGDNFGQSVSFDAGRALVGAPYADNSVADNGSGDTFLVVQPTTTSITAIAPEPSAPAQAYQVSVAVAATTGTPTGTVDVSDSDGSSCVITLASGSGSCMLSSAAAFAHTVSASYGGTLLFAASQATATHQVVKNASSTRITADTPDPSADGGMVSVTVAVSSAGGAPTGSVQIYDDTVLLCTLADVALSSVCTFTYTGVPNGARLLKAFYLGDANFSPSDDSASPEPHVLLAAGDPVFKDGFE